jgi:hypothetical protein
MQVATVTTITPQNSLTINRGEKKSHELDAS